MRESKKVNPLKQFNIPFAGLVAFSLLFSGFSPNLFAECAEGTLEETYGGGGDVCMNISAGSPGGSYFGVFGSNLSRYLDEYGFGFYKVIPSAGSFENLARIAKGESAFGLAQKDVQLYLEYKHNGTIPQARLATDEQSADPQSANSQASRFAFSNVVKVAELVDECLYVAVNKTKSTKNLADLQKSFNSPDQRPNINIGPRGSGSYYTWSFITALNPRYGYADRQRFFGLNRRLNGWDDALKELKDPKSKTEAVIWVIDPTNLNNNRLKAVLADSNLEIINFNDASLTQPLTAELLSRNPEDFLQGQTQQASGAGQAQAAEPAAAFDLLAQTLSQFNVPDSQVEQPVFNFGTEADTSTATDQTAYHLKNVRLSETGGRTVQTICTRAVYYSHKNLNDLSLKVDDTLAYFSIDSADEYKGSLWVEVLGLMKEYWSEIVSSDY